MAPLANWSENFEFEATSVEQPSSMEQLQEVVASATMAKAIGTRHSFNRSADSPGGTLIDCSELGLEMSVAADSQTATIPARWSYSKTVAELEARGLALKNLGSLPHISVAGATATATHGSGDTNQILSAEIAGVELVDAAGEIRTAEANSADLPALAVGLGAFGIFTRITLDVQPSYFVQQDYYRNTPWETFIDNFDEIMASAYSVNFHTKFDVPNVTGIWRKHRLPSAKAIEVPDELWGMHKVQGQLEAGKHTTLHEPGPWSERLAHFIPGGAPSAGGDELQSEYFVDRRHSIDALNALRAMGDQIDPHLHGSEIRTVAADDIWLSPAYKRETLSIGFTWKKHIDEVHALLTPIEEALAPFEPRPHWGKLFDFGRADLAARFPKLDDFLVVVDRYDPNGKFNNPYLQRLRP